MTFAPLITGSTGALGHHLVAALGDRPDWRPFLVVREAKRLLAPLPLGAQVVKSGLDALLLGPWPPGITHVLHLAAAWGGPEAWAVNHDATLALADRAKQAGLPFLWLGSASVLHPHGGFDAEALRIGHAYIRSKAACAQALAKHKGAWALHPTVILGAWPQGPATHASQGLARLHFWAPWLRWLRVDGSLAWIHAKDLAQLLLAWIEKPEAFGREAVAGQAPLAVAEVLAALAQANGHTYRGTLSLDWLLPCLPSLSMGAMSAWDRHALALRHHGHPGALSPESFHLPSLVPNLRTALQLDASALAAARGPWPIQG